MVSLLFKYGANPNDELKPRIIYFIEDYLDDIVNYGGILEYHLLEIIKLYIDTGRLSPEWIYYFTKYDYDDDLYSAELLKIVDYYFTKPEYQLRLSKCMPLFAYAELDEDPQITYMACTIDSNFDSRRDNVLTHRIGWYLQLIATKHYESFPPPSLKNIMLEKLLANEGDLSIYPKEFVPF